MPGAGNDGTAGMAGALKPPLFLYIRASQEAFHEYDHRRRALMPGEVVAQPLPLADPDRITAVWVGGRQVKAIRNEAEGSTLALPVSRH